MCVFYGRTVKNKKLLDFIFSADIVLFPSGLEPGGYKMILCEKFFVRVFFKES